VRWPAFSKNIGRKNDERWKIWSAPYTGQRMRDPVRTDPAPATVSGLRGRGGFLSDINRTAILAGQIILFYPSKPDHFILSGLPDKISQPLFKFHGTIPRCINISNTDSFAGRSKILIIFPCCAVFFIAVKMSGGKMNFSFNVSLTVFSIEG
jgi:hypothetical protein